MAKQDDNTKDLRDLTDELEYRLCRARGTLCLVATDGQTEPAISNAADAADAHLQDAQELLERIYKKARDKSGNTAVRAMPSPSWISSKTKERR